MKIARVAARLFHVTRKAETPARMRVSITWPKLVFIVVPVLIVAADAFVLVRDHLQPQSERAIRLVKESNSRKENFTVQQYLYTTVYYRRDQGEAITIEGWRSTTPSETGGPIVVQFNYSDSSGERVAIWEVTDQTVAAKNEAALDMSWH